MGRAKKKRQQRGSLEQTQQIASLSPSDRFVTVRATMGYSQHIYAPERSPLTLCDLTAAEEMDEGIDFEAYERACHGQHIAPKYYCAPCNRRYLRIHGIEEDRWSDWKLRVDIQVPTGYKNRH